MVKKLYPVALGLGLFMWGCSTPEPPSLIKYADQMVTESGLQNALDLMHSACKTAECREDQRNLALLQITEFMVLRTRDPEYWDAASTLWEVSLYRKFGLSLNEEVKEPPARSFDLRASRFKYIDPKDSTQDARFWLIQSSGSQTVFLPPSHKKSMAKNSISPKEQPELAITNRWEQSASSSFRSETSRKPKPSALSLPTIELNDSLEQAKDLQLGRVKVPFAVLKSWINYEQIALSEQNSLEKVWTGVQSDYRTMLRDPQWGERSEVWQIMGRLHAISHMSGTHSSSFHIDTLLLWADTLSLLKEQGTLQVDCSPSSGFLRSPECFWNPGDEFMGWKQGLGPMLFTRLHQQHFHFGQVALLLWEQTYNMGLPSHSVYGVAFEAWKIAFTDWFDDQLPEDAVLLARYQHFFEQVF
jgi:hypothetical protein